MRQPGRGKLKPIRGPDVSGICLDWVSLWLSQFPDHYGFATIRPADTMTRANTVTQVSRKNETHFSEQRAYGSRNLKQNKKSLRRHGRGQLKPIRGSDVGGIWTGFDFG